MAIEISTVTFANVKSVAELMNWAEHFESLSNGPVRRRWSYRGQPREFNTLAPSFQRQFSTSSHGAAELIEQELISAFRTHYSLLRDRSQDMPGPELISKGYDLRCLSVMQHYEVPTRLLDWTSDFWVAVYFACASDPDSHAELWVYDRSIFDDFLAEEEDYASLISSEANPPPEPPILGRRGEQLLLEVDPQLTPRMRQQKAHHTVSADVFQDHAQLLDQVAKQANANSNDSWYFRRMVINSACKGKALRYLADHRQLTASNIFPDVVGLGRFLRWQLDSLRTMLL